MGTKAVILAFSLLLTLTCLMPAPVPAQSDDVSQPPTTHGQGRLSGISGDSRTDESSSPQVFGAKQRHNIMLANLKKSKSDSAELAALAKELREELDKPNANGLSLEVMNHIDRIEKLARRIREETKGY
jgi:hypothetical protein